MLDPSLYKKSVGAIYALNGKALAKHLRDAFGEEASHEEDRESLQARVFDLYIKNNIPCENLLHPGGARIEDGASPSDPGETEELVLTEAQRELVDEEDYVYFRDPRTGLCFLNGYIEDAEGKKKKDKRPILSKRGDFPEAEKWPGLAAYQKFQDREDFVWYQSPSGRRVMLGVHLSINPAENVLPYVDITVNGMWLVAPRDVPLGLPRPHFEVLENSLPGVMEFEEVQNNQPLREVLRRMKGFPCQIYGNCLCDPKNGEVVLELDQLVVQVVAPRPAEMQHML